MEEIAKKDRSIFNIDAHVKSLLGQKKMTRGKLAQMIGEGAAQNKRLKYDLDHSLSTVAAISNELNDVLSRKMRPSYKAPPVHELVSEAALVVVDNEQQKYENDYLRKELDVMSGRLEVAQSERNLAQATLASQGMVMGQTMRRLDRERDDD